MPSEVGQSARRPRLQSVEVVQSSHWLGPDGGQRPDQIAKIGNSVPPPLVEAIVRANVELRAIRHSAQADPQVGRTCRIVSSSL